MSLKEGGVGCSLLSVLFTSSVLLFPIGCYSSSALGLIPDVVCEIILYVYIYYIHVYTYLIHITCKIYIQYNIHIIHIYELSR